MMLFKGYKLTEFWICVFSHQLQREKKKLRMKDGAGAKDQQGPGKSKVE
jgi:ribosomal protein L16/L10AE